MTELKLPDGMGPAEALRGLADDLLAPNAKLRSFVDFGREERWDSGPLKGATHGAFLRLVADLIDRKTTRNPADDVSMSAYDLLPEEERKAIAWVREHGGVAECDRKVAASMEVADSYTLLRMELGNLLGKDLMGQLNATDEELVEKIGKRLMPEGMEWRFVYPDSFPMRLGDRAVSHYGESTITSFEITQTGSYVGFLWCGKNDGVHTRAEDVKRPAPKVLDADGVEIRTGEELWLAESGEGPFRVIGTMEGEAVVEGAVGTTPGEMLTHRAPVLAADDKPLREGDTVWSIDGDGPLTVREVRPGVDPDHPECSVWCGEQIGAIDPYRELRRKYRIADQLTHERPDSWERLESDCSKFCIEYCQERGLIGDGCNAEEGDAANRHCSDCDDSCEFRMARDLVRRAKKLADAS